MTNRISSAYQQFSQQVRRQENNTSVRQVGRQQELGATSETRKSSETKSTKLSTTQKAQLKQLRETGTLDNLRSILSEDEETVLSKLFPDSWQTYGKRGEDKQILSSMQSIKGGFFDRKF